MTDPNDRLAAAVSAGVLPSDEQFGRLLHSIVEVARAIFGAKASSVLLFDEETDELVFAAVAGEGEQHLVGRRIPSSTGIAGWVLSRERRSSSRTSRATRGSRARWRARRASCPRA